MEQHIRFCRSRDGVRIAYATSGIGTPFVRVANWLTHLEFDWHSPIWRHWLMELSRYHTLIRYDARGCGLSDWDVDDFSVDAWVRDLETVVDAMELEHFPLLGGCYGAAVAIQYAVRHPERVSHLILYGPLVNGLLKPNPSAKRIKVAETLVKLIEVGWGRDNPAFRQVFTSLFVPEATVEQMRWFNDLQRASTLPENAAKLQRTFYTLDVTDVASNVTVPTLILHAREDAVIPHKQGRDLAALIPGAQFVPLESKNHVLLDDEPAWTRFLDEVRCFVGIESKSLATTNGFSELTARERDVLNLIAQGLDNTQIAAHLVISDKTVRNHITSIFSKMQVSNRAQAIVQARDAGLGRGA